MRCRALLLALLCSAAATQGMAEDTDPFEAFLAAKRDLAAQASCPAPPPAPTPAAEAPGTDDVQAAKDQDAVSEEGQSVSGMLRDAAQAMPEVAPLVDRPVFRVMGVVGARGQLEAVVDPRETGRPRLATGDLVNGWRVSRVALSEVELVHPGRDPVVLPVAATREVRQ